MKCLLGHEWKILSTDCWVESSTTVYMKCMICRKVKTSHY